MQLRPRLSILSAIAALVLGATAFAAEPIAKLEPPKSQVILTITGNITVANSEKGARLDRETLKRIGAKDIVTRTPWTDGRPRFSGVLLRDLLDAVGAKGTKITAVALDDFVYSLPIEEARKYPILLAMDMNGVPMTPRDKGPVWIVYPRDDFPELNNEETDHRMVWQVRELIIE